MNENVIDVRGLSCPEPVIRVQEALKQNGDSNFSVLVSSATARDNVQAFLEKNKREIEITEDGDYWKIAVISK